jgi:hypothetical protein
MSLPRAVPFVVTGRTMTTADALVNGVKSRNLTIDIGLASVVRSRHGKSFAH